MVVGFQAKDVLVIKVLPIGADRGADRLGIGIRSKPADFPNAGGGRGHGLGVEDRRKQ